MDSLSFANMLARFGVRGLGVCGAAFCSSVMMKDINDTKEVWSWEGVSS